MRVCALCGVCVCVYSPARRPGLPLHVAGLVQGRSGYPLLLRLLVQL